MGVLAVALQGHHPRDIAYGDAPRLQLPRIAEGALERFGRHPGHVLLPVAEIDNLDGLAHRSGEYKLIKQRKVLGQLGVDRLAVITNDNVAGADSGLLGRRILDYSRDQRASIVLVAFQPGLELDADPTAGNMPLPDQLIDDVLCQIAGDGAAERAEADLVDADDLTRQINQRTAAVAAEDHGVVPDPADDPAHVLAVQAERSLHRLGHNHPHVADDAAGDRLGDGHRATHRQHHVADLQFARIAPGGSGQRPLGGLARVELQLQHGQIAQRIGADQVGLDLLAVGQRTGDPHSVAGHVVIGDDVSVRGDDGSAAGCPLPLHPPAAGFLRYNIYTDQRRIDFLDGRFDLHSTRRVVCRGRIGRRQSSAINQRGSEQYSDEKPICSLQLQR